MVGFSQNLQSLGQTQHYKTLVNPINLQLLARLYVSGRYRAIVIPVSMNISIALTIDTILPLSALIATKFS